MHTLKHNVRWASTSLSPSPAMAVRRGEVSEETLLMMAAPAKTAAMAARTGATAHDALRTWLDVHRAHGIMLGQLAVGHVGVHLASDFTCLLLLHEGSD